MNLDSPNLMVAAIDFGTTFSGYGFSCKNHEKEIRLNKNWSDQFGYLSYKAPTSVLLDEKDEFKAFGFDAEELFNESLGEEKGFKMFRNFKMMLHDKQVHMKSTVCSEDQCLHPAIEIFTFALRYLKDHLIKYASEELAEKLDVALILWVITVPAIWTDTSKQFMREAAFRAGLIPARDSKKLVIALEPEAASFCCKALDLAKYSQETDISFPSGTRYMVLDCGGGTNDMVAHEVVVDFKIKELMSITGGPNGGKNVNERFFELLEEILGSDFISHYRVSHPVEWFNLDAKFELAKKKVRNDGEYKLKIELPATLHGTYATFKKDSITKAFLRKRDDGISFRSGMLIISNEKVLSLFSGVIKQIAKDARRAFDKMTDMKYIFMVGGFSNCELLIDAVKSEFESASAKLLVPHEAQLAIIKGAVLFGHHQGQVVSRIARRTYGIDCNVPFSAKIHDESKRFVNEDDDIRCRDIFKPLIVLDDSVEIGDKKSHHFVLLRNQVLAVVPIFCISKKPRVPVEYSDALDMVKLGTLKLKTPKLTGKKDRRITVSFTFGSTEIVAEAIDETSNNTVSTSLDFICQ